MSPLFAFGAGEEDVRRLDVAMVMPGPESKIERPRALEDDLDDALDGSSRSGEQTDLQGAAGDILHDDVAELVVDHRIVGLDDVRVRQLADQRRLVEEEVGVQPARFGDP
jgi:hypothetical protein